MLRRAWKVWLAAVLAYAGSLAMEMWAPGGLAFYGDDVLMHLAQTATVMLTAVTVYAVLDSLLLPWLNVQEVAEGKGRWQAHPPPVRAAVIAGWALVFAAFLVAWATVFAGG